LRVLHVCFLLRELHFFRPPFLGDLPVERFVERLEIALRRLEIVEEPIGILGVLVETALDGLGRIFALDDVQDGSPGAAGKRLLRRGDHAVGGFAAQEQSGENDEGRKRGGHAEHGGIVLQGMTNPSALRESLAAGANTQIKFDSRASQFTDPPGWVIGVYRS
jgi:hypothetical protein